MPVVVREHPAHGPRGRRRPGGRGRRDGARGAGPHRPARHRHAADLSGRAASPAPRCTCAVAPGDNWMIHVAVEQAQAGRHPGRRRRPAPCDDGYFGDLLAELAAGARRARPGHRRRRARRRDADRDGLPGLVARRSRAQGTVKETLGTCNVPDRLRRRAGRPGRRDRRRRRRRRASSRARTRPTCSRRRRRARPTRRTSASACAAGELGLDIYEMRERLAEKGLRYVDVSARRREPEPPIPCDRDARRHVEGPRTFCAADLPADRATRDARAARRDGLARSAPDRRHGRRRIR